MRGEKAFTLVEVLVALVVLQLGLLAVAGMVSLASRTLTAARDTQWASAVAGDVADSLAFHGYGGPGERPWAGGTVSWVTEGGSGVAEVRISVLGHRSRGDTLVAVGAILPVPPDPPGSDP